METVLAVGWRHGRGLRAPRIRSFAQALLPLTIFTRQTAAEAQSDAFPTESVPFASREPCLGEHMDLVGLVR